MSNAGHFCWYELATTDVDAAQTFYAGLLGWQVRDSGMPGIDYRLAALGGDDIAALMPVMDGKPGPMWGAYVAVAAVDATAAAAEKAGATIHVPPTDIPNVGRFAVFADPQGALLSLLQPLPGYRTYRDHLETPGAVGWNELATADIDAAWAFHAPLFGWEKGEHFDMGGHGAYQLFRYAGATRDCGGLAAPMSPAGWTFYWNVPALDAATAAVEAGGGTVSQVHEVPGGTWIAMCIDPQGARFALSAPGR